MTQHERLGDLIPPIGNCGGGIDGDHLHGSLTSEEVREVKGLYVSTDLANQEALEKTQQCDTVGEEVSVLYYPQNTRFSDLDTVVCALCAKGNCPHHR